MHAGQRRRQEEPKTEQHKEEEGAEEEEEQCVCVRGARGCAIFLLRTAPTLLQLRCLLLLVYEALSY